MQGRETRAATAGPDRGAPPGRARFVAVAGLCAIIALWVALSMTAFYVGPAEWDDTEYCNHAAEGASQWWVVNRYAHIWTLRLFFEVMDSRRTAAALCAGLTAVGLMGVAYLLGRRIGGPGCGLLAAALMPLHPVLLKYLTVPYCDQPMALWSGGALVCAFVAAERGTSRGGSLAVLAAGLFCFLSVKCKETGLAVLPPVALILWSRGRRVRTAGQWALGLLAAWILLTLADWAFAGNPWFSWRPSVYLRRAPAGSSAATTVRMGMEYVEFLSSRQFLAMTLLGLAGGLASFRRNRAVRLVVLWLAGVLWFSSWIATRFPGIQALDRYCVGIAVPLVVLGAHWVVEQWRRPAEEHRGAWLAILAAVVLFVVPAAWGLAATLGKELDPANKVMRGSFFMIPVCVIVLFAVPWLSSRRFLVRGSLVAVIVLSGTLSVQSALRYVEQSRRKLEPWIKLASELDRTGARLAKWSMPRKPLMAERLEWRCRVFSRQPADRIQARDVESLDEIKDDEWLFTDLKHWQAGAAERSQMTARGWRPFVQGYEDQQGFVVCRRPTGS